MRTLAILVLCAAATSGCEKLKQEAMEKAKEVTKAAAPAPETGGLFDDATGIPKKFGDKIGGPGEFLELNNYPKKPAGQIQDPKKHEKADRHELAGGTRRRGGPGEV